MKIVTSLLESEWEELCKVGKLFTSSLNPIKNEKFCEELKEFYREELEVEVKKPFLCVGRLYDRAIVVEKMFGELPTVLEASKGCVLLLLEVDDDIFVGFDYMILYTNPSVANREPCKSQSIYMGYLPYIDLNWVKNGWLLTDSWDIEPPKTSPKKLREMCFDV